MIIPDTFTFEYDTAARRHIVKKISSASANAAKFGVPKMFIPRWKSWNWNNNMLSKGKDEQGKLQQQQSQYFFDPGSWTYLNKNISLYYHDGSIYKIPI